MAPRHCTLAITGALALALLLPALPARADTGPYLDFGTWPDFGAPIGPEGVPQAKYSWGVEDNPVTVAEWGLQHWSDWKLRNDPADHDIAIKAADWLVSKQAADGTWRYAFDFPAMGMKAPWISSMAQGQAMSTLVRAYADTSDARYLDAAQLALRPFRQDVADGGVTAQWAGGSWYEEYPSATPVHVLNGFEFTLLGFHDLAPYTPEAGTLYDLGVRSLIAHIAVFDDPAARSQFYAALGARHVPSPPGYQHWHIVLTRELADESGSAVLASYATRWTGYLTAPSSPRRTAPAPPPPRATPAPPRRRCTWRVRFGRKRHHAYCRRSLSVLRRHHWPHARMRGR